MKSGSSARVYVGSMGLFAGIAFDVDKVVIHPEYDYLNDVNAQEELDAIYEKYGNSSSRLVKLSVKSRPALYNLQFRPNWRLTSPSTTWLSLR